MTIDTGWQESDSERFGRYGDAITPSREEHLRLLTALVPAEPDDSFLAVDLAAGSGSLCEALLRAYPNLLHQLLWLRDAGFKQVDCFWLRAGHALYGGYRPANFRRGSETRP